MTDVDLNFLAAQGRRILDEVAALRSELRGGIAGLKEDADVLTAMVLRLEGKVSRLEERLDRFSQRISVLEGREP